MTALVLRNDTSDDDEMLGTGWTPWRPLRDVNEHKAEEGEKAGIYEISVWKSKQIVLYLGKSDTVFSRLSKYTSKGKGFRKLDSCVVGDLSVEDLYYRARYVDDDLEAAEEKRLLKKVNYPVNKEFNGDKYTVNPHGSSVGTGIASTSNIYLLNRVVGEYSDTALAAEGSLVSVVGASKTDGATDAVVRIVRDGSPWGGKFRVPYASLVSASYRPPSGAASGGGSPSRASSTSSTGASTEAAAPSTFVLRSVPGTYSDTARGAVGERVIRIKAAAKAGDILVKVLGPDGAPKGRSFAVPSP